MVKLFHVDSLLQVSDSPQPSSRPSWLWWKGGSKGRNHQVRQRLKSLVTTILLRMKPGPPVPQESHLYQSFFSRAASTKFTIVLINSYIAQMPSVPTRYLKHPADSAIHPHVQHLGFLRSLGLEIPGPKQSCSKWLQFADMLRWPFKHVHLKVQKLPVEIWRMFVIFCKFQMDLCGFPQGRFAMNACGNWMKRYA